MREWFEEDEAEDLNLSDNFDGGKKAGKFTPQNLDPSLDPLIIDKQLRRQLSHLPADFVDEHLQTYGIAGYNELLFQATDAYRRVFSSSGNYSEFEPVSANYSNGWRRSFAGWGKVYYPALSSSQGAKPGAFWENEANFLSHCLDDTHWPVVVSQTPDVSNRRGQHLYRATCIEIDECKEVVDVCGDPALYDNACVDLIDGWECHCGRVICIRRLLFNCPTRKGKKLGKEWVVGFWVEGRG